MENENTRHSIYKAERPHTAEEIESDAKKRLSLINKEFAKGLALVQKYPKSVTFFGSSVLPESDPYYEKARKLAARIAKLGYAVVSGGGPGIMEAANRGAFEAKGQSIGLNIELPHEQRANHYLTDYAEFHYFFSRKVSLTFAAEAYIFLPGGYGTLNELFEILMLIQTKRIDPVPVLLYGDGYWKTLDEFIRKTIYGTHRMVEAQDVSLYLITDNEEEVIHAIKTSPVVSTIPFGGEEKDKKA
jgi:uncharacterized protein (TIGR00730 family)